MNNGYFRESEISRIVSELDLTGLRNKKILICGAGGLVGSTLTELLLTANETLRFDLHVYALGRSLEDLQGKYARHLGNEHLHFEVADVAEYRVKKDYDFIVHAASSAHPLAYSQTPVEVMKANLLGTINLLELARDCQARLVFISSGEIYGTSDDPLCAFKENEYGFTDILNPRSCYPESKRAAETLCASYGSQYGVSTSIARLCHVYGAAITTKNSRADAQFLRNACRHEDIVMKSTGSQVRSFCYVKDAAVGLLFILLKGTPGAAYNIANRACVASVRQYAETLADLAGVNIRNEFPNEAEASGFSKITRAVLDESKLNELGWHPVYDLREGLKDTLALCERTK